MGLPHSSVDKESACNAGDPGSIPGSGRSTGDGMGHPLQYSWASLVAQLVKNWPAVWETWVQSLGWEDTLEKGKATHSSILSMEIHHEYWSGLPCPSPCYLPNPGIKPKSPTLQANSLPAELPGKPLDSIYICINIRYLFFSFWLTSLCITGSRFTHLTRTTQICFSLWLSNIPLYICTTSSLSIRLSMDV